MSVCVLLVALSSFAPAQSQPDEKPFLEAAAKKLDAYATLCFKNGYPRKAREAWHEVLNEYDADDAVARESLGFKRVGDKWYEKTDFEYTMQETLNATVAANLQKKWEALAKELADGHRNLAEQFEAAANVERHKHHMQRVLRFQPTDGKAGAALGRRNFEGLVGTDDEIQLLKRSRLMERAIARQLATQYKVEKLPADAKHPVLQQGGVPYTGVKSEHFTVYGDWEPSMLEQAATYAERALQFCKEAFAGYEGFPPRSGVTRTFGLFKQKATWAQIVRANEGAIGHDMLEFVLANASSLRIGSGAERICLGGHEDVATVQDYVVRMVAEDYSGVHTDGMNEGIGHAIVGMFFGRVLIYLVGREEEKGTSAGRKQRKLLVPDMQSWNEMAIEAAWLKAGTPAARLPLLRAASFPDDGRIKAWAICDYLLRLDPVLLRELDRTGPKARNENDVRAAFREAAGRSIDSLEQSWREYLTRDTPLKRAIEQKVTPLEAASKDAPAWLQEFNRLRESVQRSALGWTSSLSADCRQHAEYLAKNRTERGPDKEHTQDSGKEAWSNSGRTFARDALVSTADKDPRKAMANWLHWPGYRDAVLNQNIDSVGLWVEGTIAVLDASRGHGPGRRTTSHWPFASLAGNQVKDPVPASVDVAELGGDVARLLQQNGRGKQKAVGYPLSLHFYGTSDWGTVTCTLRVGGDEVPGVLVDSSGGRSRRSSAHGMWVFYPLDPLRRGTEYHLAWSWKGGSAEAIFLTQ